MKKLTPKLRRYYLLSFICFLVLIIILIMNIGNANLGQAVSIELSSFDKPAILFFIIFLILLSGSIMLVFLNSVNPHFDHELSSFKVDKKSSEQNLFEYLKFCKEKGRNFSDVKDLLMGRGWEQETIRKIGDKINN